MINLDVCFRKACGSGLPVLVRKILSDRELPYGAQVMAFHVLDLPMTPNPSNALLARKMLTSTSQVSVWRKVLEARGYQLRPDSAVNSAVISQPQLAVVASGAL